MQFTLRPSLALTALLHDTRAVGVSQTLWRHGTRNGITKLSLLVIFNKGPTYIPRAVITLGIGPHSSSLCCPFPSFSRPPFHSACLPPFFHVPRFLHYASFRTRTDLLKAPITITKGVVIFKLSGGLQNVWGFCFLTHKGHWISPVFGRR